MQYLLTEEEYHAAHGVREKMRQEFQAKIDAKLSALKGEILKELKKANISPVSYSNLEHPVMVFSRVIAAAFATCKLEPEPEEKKP